MKVYEPTHPSVTLKIKSGDIVDLHVHTCADINHVNAADMRLISY